MVRTAHKYDDTTANRSAANAASMVPVGKATLLLMLAVLIRKRASANEVNKKLLCFLQVNLASAGLV